MRNADADAAWKVLCTRVGGTMSVIARALVTSAILTTSFFAADAVHAQPSEGADPPLVRTWVRDREDRAATLRFPRSADPAPLCRLPCVIDVPEGTELRIDFEDGKTESKDTAVARGEKGVTTITTSRDNGNVGLGVVLAGLGIPLLVLGTTLSVAAAASSGGGSSDYSGGLLAFSLPVGGVGLLATIFGFGLAFQARPTTIEQRVSGAGETPAPRSTTIAF
ncbi:MAG: hypothetical protein JST00_34480 [Deltaproteobacteria bacterium]|nr:hypothetical protein [Deltaproteobacteria bacterium]